MAYVPNPQDTSNPTDAIIAETAAAEFRAIKTYLAGLVFATGTRIPVRQTVLNGPVSSSGVAAFLAISATAFGVDLLATNSNGLTATWANGYSGNGATDAIQTVGNDLLNYWPSLLANNTSYLALDYVQGVTLTTVTNGPYAAGAATITVASTTTPAGEVLPNTTISLTLDDGSNFSPTVTAVNSVTNTLTLGSGIPVGRSLATGINVVGTNPLEVQTLASPQNSRTYDATKQSVLQFGGAAASTTFLDDFGNTWTANGAAKVQTNQFKFGTGALGGSGTNNALVAATPDRITSSNFSTLGAGGWSLRAWIQPTVLPANNTTAVAISAQNGSAYGAILGIVNVSGTIKFGYDLSSSGSGQDIASATQGTTTPSINTWYFVELTFDALAGVYRLYVNGTQEASTASTAKICGIANMGIGAYASNLSGLVGLSGYIDKFEFLPYCQHPGGTAYANPTAAPNVATVGYSGDWFDTINYKMWQVQSPSVAAGTSPIFHQINRLYVGEGDTNGGAVAAVRSYAIQGKFIGTKNTPLPGGNTVISQNHNIGSHPGFKRLVLSCLTAEDGYAPGDELEFAGNNDSGAHWSPLAIRGTKLAISAGTSANPWQIAPGGGGGITNLTVGNWAYRFEAQRNF